MPPFVRAVLRVATGAVAVMGATPHENHNLVTLFVALEFGVFAAHVLRNWGTRYSGPERRHSYAVRHAHYV